MRGALTRGRLQTRLHIWGFRPQTFVLFCSVFSITLLPHGTGVLGPNPVVFKAPSQSVPKVAPFVLRVQSQHVPPELMTSLHPSCTCPSKQMSPFHFLFLECWTVSMAALQHHSQVPSVCLSSTGVWHTCRSTKKNEERERKLNLVQRRSCDHSGLFAVLLVRRPTYKLNSAPTGQ